MPLRDSLDHEGFRYLWAAQIVSAAGSRLEEIAFVYLVYSQTGSIWMLTFAVTAAAVPSLVAALPSGVVADRWNRKYLMILSDFVRAGAVASLPLLIWAGVPTLYVVVGVGVAYSLGGTLFGPARNAMLPNLVPEDTLDEANGLAQMTSLFSRSLYVVAGGLIASVGTLNVFFVDAATFLGSAAILFMLPTRLGDPERDDDEDASAETEGFYEQAVNDAREAISFVRGHRVLFPMLLLQVSGLLLVAPLGALVLPVFNDTFFAGDSTTYGILYGSFYVGMFVSGGFLSDMLDWRVTHGEFIVWGQVISGFFITLMAMAPTISPLPFLTTLLFHAAAGAATIVGSVAAQTLIQTIPSDDTRGKVFSVLTAAGMAAPPVAYGVAGPLLAEFGPAVVLYGVGAGLMILGVMAAFTPMFGASVDEESVLESVEVTT